MRTLYVLAVLLLFFVQAKSQDILIDTLYVNGVNRQALANYASYWVDSTKKASIYDSEKAFINQKFQHWDENKTLNLGKNPYPLWLHLTVKNKSDRFHDYWWAIYTQADTITFYKKENKQFTLYDKIINTTLRNNKKVRTRFPATKISLQPNQIETYFVKIENLRNTQNAIMDLTTPEDNLMWEKKFYWQVGFFIGCFLLIAVLCFCVSIFTKEITFFLYAFYLILIVIISLREEIMVRIIDNQFILNCIHKLHSLPSAIVALALHFYVIKFIFYDKSQRTKIRILSKLNLWFLGFGLVFSVIYFIFKAHLFFDKGLFPYLWDIGVVIVFSIMFITLLAIVLKYKKSKKIIAAILVGSIFLYYNPAGYFLNYAGILNYYTITYPNYFYWIVCFEFILIGCFMAWRYRNTTSENVRLLQEKAIEKERDYRKKIEIQQKERIEVAKDLHDDLGATISALKLIITNNYKDDMHLATMISKASTDLKLFFNKLTLNGLDQPLSMALQEKINAINSSNQLKITFICLCEDIDISTYLHQDIYKICNELINNIINHSKAKEATLQIIKDENTLEILAEDDGIGFDSNKKYSGIGLKSMKARVRKLKGTLYISSNSKGSTFIINLPIKSG